MFMAEYKMKYSNNLYYSDTDSLVLDCKLPEDLVGPNLGQFKLEYQASEGVFISPKVYALKLAPAPHHVKEKGGV